MTFDARYDPPATRDEAAYWYAFASHQLLVNGAEEPTIPLLPDLAALGIDTARVQYLGRWQDTPCYTTDLGEEVQLPDGYSLSPLRPLFGVLPDEQFWHAGRAYHLTAWARNHRHCGRCGAANRAKGDERARQCPACGHIAYPRISPAVIVAVVRDGRILLAHHARYTRGFYSVLAGFVEPGETLEQCVAREVREEVGLEVTDIRYFGSQPWPFPDSLMIAFTAQYAGGDIVPEEGEIVDARWFAPDALPEHIPGPLSVSRRLIDWFVATYGPKSAEKAGPD